ncbi:hypothetical protein Pmar_PMAR003776, partial [Perkinsus marinus ATCC 50983]
MMELIKEGNSFSVDQILVFIVTGFSMGGSEYPVMVVNDRGILDTGAEYTLPTLIKDLEARSSGK